MKLTGAKNECDYAFFSLDVFAHYRIGYIQFEEAQDGTHRKEYSSIDAPKTLVMATFELRKLRECSDTDFSICCEDVSIPVHSLVMKTFWPYFKSMSESDCSETAEKTLKLDSPASWVQKLVSYLYGEELELDFDEMTGLMKLGALYQLPELAEMTAKEILSVPKYSLGLEEVIAGWKRASEVGQQEVKKHLAMIIVGKHKSDKSELTGFLEKYEGFETHEALELLYDTLSI